jgi:hypothetical protein
MGGDFIKNPEGLNFLFLKLELTFTFFYLFFIFLETGKFQLKTELKNDDGIDDVLRKGYGFLKQKKRYKIHSNYFLV